MAEWVARAEQLLTFGALISLIWAAVGFALKLRADARQTRDREVSAWREANAVTLFHEAPEGQLTLTEFKRGMDAAGFSQGQATPADLSWEVLCPILTRLVAAGVIQQLERNTYGLHLRKTSAQDQGAALLMSNTMLAPRVEQILKGSPGLRLEEIRGKLSDLGERVDRFQMAGMLTQMHAIGLAEPFTVPGPEGHPSTVYWRSIQ